MILVLVFFGVIAGSTAAVLAFLGGGGFFGALAAYALFGTLAVGLTALLAFLAPARSRAIPNEWADLSRELSQTPPPVAEQPQKPGTDISKVA